MALALDSIITYVKYMWQSHLLDKIHRHMSAKKHVICTCSGISIIAYQQNGLTLTTLTTSLEGSIVVQIVNYSLTLGGENEVEFFNMQVQWPIVC